MKVVGLIPARGGSKSIPHKNIIQLGGHPLIAYSITASKLSQLINETVVSTDSEQIADIAVEYGADVPFLRPAEISQDDSLDIELFRHYLMYLEKNSIKLPDLIVHLRPTTPLRDPEIIDAAIRYMLENEKPTALRSAHKTHLTPYKMFYMEEEFMIPFLKYEGIKESYNLPRQFFKDCYLPNGYVDIVRPSIINNSGMLHGERIKLWPTEPVPDIDVFNDLDSARIVLKDKDYLQIRKYLESCP
ncbi:MAG: acylneuraminate cytidylyltransferase family protein [Proteobacteria bacterium]|nr:acylneuraminate cytidylyltransferase family protein [Pseudomonadota bacterium]